MASRDECDVYFSADVETDGPIPGIYSMLSFALVPAGAFDGRVFSRPRGYSNIFYRELRPITPNFQPEALRVNGLDRDALARSGGDPAAVMTEAARWVVDNSPEGRPVLVAYPLSFDWSWLYWYFTRFCAGGSPFNHSQCYDLKTAFAVKARLPIAQASRTRLPGELQGRPTHTHNAADDAIEQAIIFGNLFEWGG